MCGIAGIYRFDGAPVPISRGRRMAAAMRHRGPDDEGYVGLDVTGERPPILAGGPATPPGARGYPLSYAPPAVDPPADAAGRGLVLGQRRLAIIDLSPGGHQPLASADGRVWLVFGGEIYNHVELRAELEAAGHRFQSSSDTEVIAEGYVEWGDDVFRRMNGMWSIALWDVRRRRLLLSRDRCGVKPLYVRFGAGELVFASEIRALFAAGGVPAEVDPSAVRELIADGRVDTGERTFFSGIRALPPAAIAVAGPDGFDFRRYWHLEAPGGSEGRPDADGGGGRAAETLRALLTDSVRLRLRSDVRVGSCLSGGIDSSSVVALGTRLLGAPMDAYSVAYDEGEAYDERRHMQAAVAATGARHHLIVPKGEQLLEELVQVTIAQEEPSAGPGVYSQWQVMRLAGQDHAKVLLDGQGADELFGGYFAFYYPPRLRGLLAAGDFGAALALARAAVARGHSPLEVVARAAEPWIPRELFRRGRLYLGAGDWARALGPELRHAAHGAPDAAGAFGASAPAGFAPRPGLDPLTARQAADLTSLLLPSLLRYEDRNSMAFSIEARVPFLDYRVIELAFQLPPAAKLHGGETKGVLRRAMRGVVPDSILDRSDKRGFETPVMPWLLRGHAAWLRDLLLAGRAVDRGLLDSTEVAAMLDRNAGGLRGPGHELWRMVSLELWLRAAFDAAGFATAAATAAAAGGEG